MSKVRITASSGTINGLRAVAILFGPDVRLPYVPAARELPIDGRMPTEPAYPTPLLEALNYLRAYGVYGVSSRGDTIFVTFWSRPRQPAHEADTANLDAVYNALLRAGSEVECI